MEKIIITIVITAVIVSSAIYMYESKDLNQTPEEMKLFAERCEKAGFGSKLFTNNFTEEQWVSCTEIEAER